MRNLTEREREIAELIVRGISNREVAKQLGIAHGTANVHLNNIYRKLGINNRVLLAMAWLRYDGKLEAAE